MGKRKRNKGPSSDNTIASPQVGVAATTPGRGGSEGHYPRSQSSLRYAATFRGGTEVNSNQQLPTITRGPESLRQQMQVGSPVQRMIGNQAVVLKVEHMSKIATWAAAAVPSLGAFYGQRLASTCQTVGIPSPVLNTQCERCETVLLPGVNSSVRVAAPKKKKSRCRKAKTGDTVATVNVVVYQCHFCKYGSQKLGSRKEDVKTKLAELAARAQMKHLATCSDSPAISSTTPLAHGAIKTSCGDDTSSTPVTAAESLAIVSSAGALRVDQSVISSSSKKRKRKGWTSLKAIATSLQNRDLLTPD